MVKPINFKVNYDKTPEPLRTKGAGATDPGSWDILRDLENPNMLVPPITDAGTVPNLRFSFSRYADISLTLILVILPDCC